MGSRVQRGRTCALSRPKEPEADNFNKPLPMAQPAPRRNRSPVAVLLDPQKDIALGERDIRLEDWLNDKFQTSADLGTLDSLLESVELSKRQLDQQLHDAREKLEISRKDAMAKSAANKQQALACQQQQHAIDRRLKNVTSSASPEEAIAKLRRPMDALERVEMVQKYMGTLDEIDRLSDLARQHLPHAPKEALKPYIQLKSLSVHMRKLQEPAEGAATHLVRYIDGMSRALWKEMYDIMAEEFERVLREIDWPEISKTASNSDSNIEFSKEWSDCFEGLLDLQYPEIVEASEPVVLIPIDLMTDFWKKQFRYHFLEGRPTGDPENLKNQFLEWFVGHMLLREDFLRTYVGPVLASHWRGTPMADSSLYTDPMSAVINAMLPILKEKAQQTLEGIEDAQGSLGEFLQKLLEFDENIRTKFGFNAGDKYKHWRGLSFEILGMWFDTWLDQEKAFANTRYREIMNPSENHRMDYDATAEGKTKPTFAAMQLMDLLQSFTPKYQKIPGFKEKFRFLIEVQAETLDMYQKRLDDGLLTYYQLTSMIGRMTPAEQRAQAEGIKGLDSLCKIHGSAQYVLSQVKEWSNDLFFIGLWDDLQDRAKKTDPEKNLVGAMSYQEVKDSTSGAVGTDDNGSMWDATIDAFQKIEKRALEYMVNALKYSYPKTFSHYTTRPQWTTVGNEPCELTEDLSKVHADRTVSDLKNIAITPELDQPLRVLREELSFLYKALSQTSLRKVTRESLFSLENFLWNEVLMRQDFTTLGAARFLQDVVAIESAMTSHIAGVSTLNMPRLQEAVTLLNLPVETEADELGLLEMKSKLWEGVPQAEKVLKENRYFSLSVAEARDVLKRRREAST